MVCEMYFNLEKLKRKKRDSCLRWTFTIPVANLVTDDFHRGGRQPSCVEPSYIREQDPTTHPLVGWKSSK